MLPAAITGGPDKDGALATAPVANAFDERTRRQLTRSVHRFTVIIRAPGGTVNVDVLRVVPERSRLDDVRHIAIQHTYTTDPRSESDSHRTLGIVGRGRNFTGAPRSVAVRVG